MSRWNTFAWYELMTTDVDAAEAFYRDVVGWTAHAFPNAAMRYTILNAGETGVAGIMAIPPDVAAAGGRPAWLGYIAVEDVDATAKRIRDAGGTVHREPADIPDVGRFSVVADPQGAIFMLLTPKGADRPAPPPMTPGHVGWHELYALDGEKAFGFYAAQFGWTKVDAMDMGPMGVYQLFATGDMPIGGMMTKPPAMPVPAWGYYFIVPALDAAIARISAGGGQVVHGPMEVPGGSHIVQAIDPQGAVFALVAARR